VVLTLGNKVFYPYQGLCVIGAVVNKVVDGNPRRFYHLAVLEKGGGDLFIPVDKVETVGIRSLLKKTEIPLLLERLKQPAQAAEHYRQRTLDNAKLIASGSAFDLVEIVASLSGLSDGRKLSFGEQKTFEKAKRLLICEIAEVLRETQETAEEQVEQALKARSQENQPVSRI
jgi:RNA polymerase-interacting CarD/CdnL/TRCF family regulator